MRFPVYSSMGPELYLEADGLVPSAEQCIDGYDYIRLRGYLRRSKSHVNWDYEYNLPFEITGRIDIEFFNATIEWLGYHSAPESSSRIDGHFISVGGTGVDAPFTIHSHDMKDLTFRAERAALFNSLEYKPIKFEDFWVGMVTNHVDVPNFLIRSFSPVKSGQVWALPSRHISWWVGFSAQRLFHAFDVVCIVGPNSSVELGPGCYLMGRP